MHDYWWIIPLLLFLLCFVGCVRGRRRGGACGCCGAAEAMDAGGER